MPDDDPIPPRSIADPSPLTTAMLLREVAHIRIELASEVKNIGTRFDDMDKAVDLFKADLVRFPTDVEKEVGNLKGQVAIQIDGLKDQIAALREIINERFRTTGEQFAGIGKQFQLNELALNAALSAAKQLVDRQTESFTLATTKSETAANKLMDQMRDMFNTNNSGLNDKIDDGRNRMTQLEARLVGLLQDVSRITAVTPTPPVPPPAPPTTPIGLWLMMGANAFLLVIVIIFEIMQRVPVGGVR